MIRIPNAFLAALGALVLGGCAGEARPPSLPANIPQFRLTCQSDHPEIEPCISEARRTCPAPRIREARYQVTPYTTSVDGYGKTLYQYDTVYVCPAKQAAG